MLLPAPTNTHPSRPASAKMGFRSSRSPQDPEKNADITSHKSILTRILAWILPTLRRPAPDQQPPAEPTPSESLPWWEQLPKKEPELPYSEAESRQASTKLWSIYIGEAERYDKALVESWKGDMEGMLIFSGLFSASLTAFLIESYQTLRPDSGDVMVQLLSQITQQLGSNSSTASPGSPADPFQPTASSLVCNTFWFISLTLSITCALLATLVEQWAREFLHRTDKHPSPIRRARIFSFLYFGLRRFGMHTAVELIPLLLHISLMLFLAGLVAFLLPVNHIMVGLIASILGGFLVIYAILTVLPVIRLDSPFKTPFSGVLWNLFHKLPTNILLPQHWTSPSSTTMSDAMVEMALRPSEHRDRRAIKWTLESLTDDSELLPFLEAIPDVICGPGGFHRRNDGLFIHLLDIATNPYTLFEHEDIHRNPLSLSERITDFLTSCGNLDVNDPARRHGLTVGIKCLWALGMISDTTYHCEYSGGGFWFSQKTQKAVYAVNDELENLSDSYGLLASAAIRYSGLNNFRKLVISASRLTDPIQLVEDVRNVVEMASMEYSGSTALSLRTNLLSAWSDDSRKLEKTVEVQSILQSLVEDMPWVEASVSIVADLLISAVDEARSGCPILLAAYSQTCLRMVPVIHYIPIDQRNARSLSFTAPAFDASPTPAAPGELSDLDHIMKMFFRLLPQLRPEDAIPGFASYLGKRNDLHAIQFATTDCGPLRCLTESLIVMLQPHHREDNILQALSAICLLPRYDCYLYAWDEQDDQLWDYMTTTDIFSIPLFSTLSAVTTLRKCSSISILARKLVADGPPSEAKILQLRDLSNHCFLPERPAPMSVECTPENILADIRNRATQAKVVALTAFLAACLQPLRPIYMGDAARILLDHLGSASLEAVDFQVLAEFCQAWVEIIHHLLKTPTDIDLDAVAGWILRWAHIQAKFRYPASAPLFKDVLSLHLRLLQTHASKSQLDIDKTTQITDELASMGAATSYITVDDN
ncbi:hypothetical protein DFH06DRAFT_124694 [Mycena polygramma]|nr:hypothetical protein DFH06DRAFT_124694 [Mycena polygramma]